MSILKNLLLGALYRLVQAAGWVILRVGFGLRVQGRHHLPRHGGCIIASNHLSFIDPVALAAACPRRLVFLARTPLFEIPVLGVFMRLMSAIPVDRDDTSLNLRHALRRLRQGQVVVIFPEGGRQFSGTLGAARPGVGLLAAHADVPIVPALAQGTFEALPPNARMLRPAKIRVAFGPQIRYPNAPLAEASYTRLAEEVTASWHRLLAAQTHDTDRGSDGATV